MMKKSLLWAALVLPAIAFTSCLSSDGENRQESTINYGGAYCFNVVTDLQSETREWFISTEPQYSFVLEAYSAKATPSMSNIKLIDGQAGLSFKLPDLDISFNTPNYSYTCAGSGLTPVNQTSNAYVFNNFSLKVIERNIRNSAGAIRYSPVYDLSYTVNNLYQVTVFPTGYDLLGTTIATTDVDYTDKGPIYTITFDPEKKTASINITDARFASEMTSTSLRINNLPYTVTRGGLVINTPEDATYVIRDAAGEIKGSSISDVKLNISVPSGTTSLSFHASMPDFQGVSKLKSFDVRASLSYYYPTDGKQ